MNRYRWSGRLNHVVLSACCAAGVVMSPPRAFAQAEPELIGAEQLPHMSTEFRRGGYVFYFRHALTRLDQEDQQPVRKGDCATQRNLSEAGVRQASVIGAAFKHLQIPVGRVLSSPFCRTRATARLAFEPPELNDDLYFAVGLPKAERAAKGDALRRMLAEKPAAGKNTVIVAHTANLEEAVGYWPKPEGAAVVFQPDGAGGFRMVGRIPPEAWSGVSATGVR